MKVLHSLGAIAALALTAAAPATTTLTTIEFGTMLNTGGGAISYTGQYSQFITSSLVPVGTTQHTVIGIDLAGLLASIGNNALYSVTVTDTGLNTYGALSPGADVDWFVFQQLPAGASVTYDYDGPNAVHNNEDPSRWAQRVSLLDSFSGAQDAYHLTHLSLGNQGAVTALFTVPSGGGPTDGGVIIETSTAGGGLNMLLSEHGTVESFRVTIHSFNFVPAPGALSLLGAAGLVGLRGRRRCA